MARNNAAALQAAANARAPLRALPQLYEAVRHGGPAVTAHEFSAAMQQACSPANPHVTRSQALTVVLQTAHHSPELATPQELARLVTLRQQPANAILGRQAGNILGLLLHRARTNGKPESIIVHNGKRLMAAQAPAVLDMGGHVLLSLGTPQNAAVQAMLKAPHAQPVATDYQLYVNPVQLVQTLAQGSRSAMRHVVPAVLTVLQKADAIHAERPIAFRGASTTLQRIVRELDGPQRAVTQAMLPSWPQNVQQLFKPR